MRADIAVVSCSPRDAAGLVVERLTESAEGYVLVHAPEVDVAPSFADALAAALDAPMAASASPLPVDFGTTPELVFVPLDARLPPPPTLSAPCTEVCLISRAAVASIGPFKVGRDWEATCAALRERLVAFGWRHVAAPGVVRRWTPWPEPASGSANAGLSTHQLWARTRVHALRLVVDGACLTEDQHTGSQAVVWNVSLALARTRPDAEVSLAVPAAHVDHVRQLAAGTRVTVVRRHEATRGFDVVYRPYQPLDPGELGWLASAGDRLVTSQLDMIAFSNPEYHPSSALFHAVRNLQRLSLRLADGVTFISEFGREGALGECPDLDRDRTTVVMCGADPSPIVDPQPAPAVSSQIAGRPLIACTSATFWHKNRQHAIRTFDALCRRHDYPGVLVIAGPEPYYGRSSVNDDAIVAGLAPGIRERVLRVGKVDAATKWWLLAEADVVLYPSTVEGFGLVPFEAAAVGSPCLVAPGSALAEVLGGTSAVVGSWDPFVWAERAAELVDSPAAAGEHVAHVRARASELTWDATAQRTWSAIDAALARPPRRQLPEEGGLASRVAGPLTPLAAGARLAHFTSRLRSYAQRRIGR